MKTLVKAVILILFSLALLEQSVAAAAAAEGVSKTAAGHNSVRADQENDFCRP